MSSSPPIDFSKQFGSSFVPEDKDQAIVDTPFGKGIVVRTRKHGLTSEFSMREIELVDWTRPQVPKGIQKPHMLYSPAKFPSVKPKIGDEVLTTWGRGKVVEIRDDDPNTHVIKLSSWRLAGRSSVMCYVSANDIEVMRPYRIYDMSIWEKVEHAEHLKHVATKKFNGKDFPGALEIYAKAVDAVRYVQHGKDSTNELRADLLVVMITCSNNAGTCCLHLKNWERAESLGHNALILIDALEERKDSKIRKIINADGIGDSQLFGSWKVKSLLLIAKSQMERHDPSEAMQTLKKATQAIAAYKQGGDGMFKQLSIQEREVRRIYNDCTQRIKAIRRKEKQRARAMFGSVGEEKKDSEKKTAAADASGSPTKAASVRSYSTKECEVTVTSPATENIPHDRVGEKAVPKNLAKKRVSFADGSIPGDSDDDDLEYSFLGEHKEAVFIMTGIVMGFLAVHLMFKKR